MDKPDTETATDSQGIDPNRRPIASRSLPWIQRLAQSIAHRGITPNSISMLSIVFAAAGAGCLLWVSGFWGLLGCALGIQLRLLCNLIDGMVAIEGGKKTPAGALYNEVPDRVADSVLIIALGHAIGQPWLGWLGALAAACTAYIRVLGGSLGLTQHFGGPMAKQHRMAIMTVACLIGLIEAPLNHSQHALVIAAWAITVGSLLTCGTRLQRIARELARKDQRM